MTLSSNETAAEHGIRHVPAGTGTTVWFSGDVYTVMLTADDTDASLGVIYGSVPPGGGPPAHYHAEHDELFYLLDGELQFSENADTFTVNRGDIVFIKRGSVHNFRNSGLFPATMLFLYAPGEPEGLFVEGGDTPVAGEHVEPWGPDRIDSRLVALLDKYDNRLPGAPGEAPPAVHVSHADG